MASEKKVLIFLILGAQDAAEATKTTEDDKCITEQKRSP